MEHDRSVCARVPLAVQHQDIAVPEQCFDVSWAIPGLRKKSDYGYEDTRYISMHAHICIPNVMGIWKYQGVKGTGSDRNINTG